MKSSIQAPELTIGEKAANAGYRGKATVFPDGMVEVVPDPDYANFPHELDQVEIAWYNDRVKVSFKAGGPALVSQMYLSGKGKSVIIELKPEDMA
jgi:hypothetical protein